MKKTVLLAITSLELLAMDAQKALDSYIDAWNAHDHKAITAHYSENVIWYDLSYDTTLSGKEVVSKAITDAFLTNVSKMYWHKSGDVFVSDNTIIYEWVYGGYYSGVFLEQMINHREFMLKGISTTTFNEAGKIVSQKDYYDFTSLKKSLMQ